MWDIEVDVACVGAGPATLASAVVTADAGATVLLATPLAERGGRGTGITVRPRVAGFLGSWSRFDRDAQTARYLAAVARGRSTFGDSAADTRMTTRTVTARTHAVAESFIGSHLGTWNATCLGSPYGMLFSSVSGWRTEQMRAEEGHPLEVIPVGAVSGSDAAGGFDATAWLEGQVGSRGIRDHRFVDLERIVFDDGRIVGVELATPDGVLSVGIRHGLSLTSGRATAALPTVSAALGDDLRMCIVGRPASRFLRLELLGTTVRSRPMCTASGRPPLRAGREPQRLRSGAGRCGKLHGHSAFGE